MNVGYVRLSRDDDKRNYISIENQKLIIRQFAAECGVVIDRWYEDDGISGYIFNRPGLNRMLDDLDKIERVFVKDLSRIGRHNARVLLFLEDFKERRKELVVVDTNYNSGTDEDDTIGILTWYNEKYVKDISRKIKSAMEARQKEGILMTQPPFGYKRNEEEKTKLEIIPEEAECIKMVCDLYLKGLGYRRISNYLTENKVPTPSMLRQKSELAEGKISKRTVAGAWSDSMVKEILDNDFYIGNLRLHKRARFAVHGKDKRIPKKEQYVFENHHPAILEKATFEKIQELKEKRVKIKYRGSFGEMSCISVKTIDGRNGFKTSLFGNLLFCKDCGSHLTLIKRSTTAGERRYYICTTYNTKGKRYCEKSHLVEENALIRDILTYLKLCRDSLCGVIASYDIKELDSEKRLLEEKRLELLKQIEEQKSRLKVLFTQKIRDLSNTPENEKLIKETYDTLQQDIISQIHELEGKLQESAKKSLENEVGKEPSQNALEILDNIMEKKIFNEKDMEILIERIEADKDGLPEIRLKYGLSGLHRASFASVMNRMENEVIYQTMKLIHEEDRDYTSAKYLSKALTEAGFAKSVKSVLPYIGLMMEMQIVEATDNPRKPYTIIKSKAELQEMMNVFYTEKLAKSANDLHEPMANRWYAGNGI